MVYRRFVRFDTNPRKKIRISRLIRLDDFIINSVDLLSHAFKGSDFVSKKDHQMLPRENLRSVWNNIDEKKSLWPRF